MHFGYSRVKKLKRKGKKYYILIINLWPISGYLSKEMQHSIFRITSLLKDL